MTIEVNRKRIGQFLFVRLHRTVKQLDMELYESHLAVNTANSVMSKLSSRRDDSLDDEVNDFYSEERLFDFLFLLYCVPPLSRCMSVFVIPLNLTHVSQLRLTGTESAVIARLRAYSLLAHCRIVPNPCCGVIFRKKRHHLSLRCPQTVLKPLT